MLSIQNETHIIKLLHIFRVKSLVNKGSKTQQHTNALFFVGVQLPPEVLSSASAPNLKKCATPFCIMCGFVAVNSVFFHTNCFEHSLKPFRTWLKRSK